MDDMWQGKSAFITGAASGIGRALAKALAARGAIVCATDIDGAGAKRVADECGHGATGIALDVCDASAVRAAVNDFARRCGRLDYLFNNAGIGMGGEVHEIPLAAWRRVVDINLWGVIHGVQAAYPLMRQQGFGHIVNTASMAGLIPAPLLTPYSVTKHAVVGLSTSLRVEAAPAGVRVSVLCPGVIETPILSGKLPEEAGTPWWLPDLRRYLAKLGGPAYPVDRMVDEALEAIARNPKFIVIPRRARIGWFLARLFPTLPDKLLAPALAFERAQRKESPRAAPQGVVEEEGRVAQ